MKRRTEARAGRRAVAFALLVALAALWPLAQRALVVRFAIDPWKLGGFAMYTTYQTSVAALFLVTPTGYRPIDEAHLSRAGRVAFDRFRARRSALGRLVDPDEAVRRIHADHPELENLVVVVQRLWLDPADGRIASDKAIYPYAGGRPVP